MAYVPSGMSIGEKLRNSPKRNDHVSYIETKMFDLLR